MTARMPSQLDVDADQRKGVPSDLIFARQVVDDNFANSAVSRETTQNYLLDVRIIRLLVPEEEFVGRFQKELRIEPLGIQVEVHPVHSEHCMGAKQRSKSSSFLVYQMAQLTNP